MAVAAVPALFFPVMTTLFCGIGGLVTSFFSSSSSAAALSRKPGGGGIGTSLLNGLPPAGFPVVLDCGV